MKYREVITYKDYFEDSFKVQRNEEYQNARPEKTYTMV